MGHAALRLWRHKTVWVVEGAAGAGGEQSASWRVVAVDSSAVESPLYGRKNGRYHCLCKLFKISGAKAILLPPPSPTSFRGRRFVKTFRDSSTTAGDGDVDDVCRSGIPANEEIRSLDFPGRSSSLIVWKGEFEFVFPLNGE